MFSRLLRLVPGLLLYGVADAFMIRAAIGVDPWTVFAQGMSVRTGLGIGLLTNIIGLAVLLLWIPLRQKPGLGTLLNIMLVGPGIELGLWLLPTPETLWAKIAFFAAGLLLLAIASGIYIGAHLGPGPRDGLMTGIHNRFGTPIWMGRTAVEVTVLLIGWALGGNAGIGTLAFALLIGPLCGITLPLLDPVARHERRERKTSGAGRHAPQPRKPEGESDERPYSTPSTTLL
ncbi:membrane protein YczE [Leucobacter sp. VD1]|uniref:membrane protein YczE n=1 Tax=Leucobacter sp. VD1 TaxID=3080381 RepID=UPI00301925A7